MNDSEFDQVPQLLFEGVDSLNKCGSPGTLIPMTHNTRAVLCGDDSNNVIIVASRFDQGRCLIFAHNGYLEMFFETQTTKDKRFVKNCRRWLAQGQNAKFVSIDDMDSIDDVETDRTILVWNGNETKNDTFMNDLCDHLRQGGSLICGTTAWGWLEGNDDKRLCDFPFVRFCDYMGVKITDNIANCPDSIPFRPELISFKNIYHVVHDLVKDPNNTQNLTIVRSAIKELGDTLPGVLIETLANIVMSVRHEIIPVNSCPIRDKACREQSTGICGIFCALPGIKAPGVSHFPGDFDKPPRIEMNMTYSIESKYSEWFCTGYYVAAGIPIQIDVLQQIAETGWSVRIGCHSDDLEECDELRRWSCISKWKSLDTKSVSLNSAFGGLLFLQSPDEDGSSSITVRLYHVVLTPTYDLTNPNRAVNWQYQRNHAQGLWADIAGRYIVFNIPSQSVRHLNSVQLDRVLQFWDSIVLAHHELRGTKPTHRERVVCDEQPSMGYMHSGYPVVTHMDMSDPNNDGFIFNSDTLEKNGSWGLFHELGHNMQQDWWTFDGTDEVTVNIFTLHAMDKICHLQPWIHSWLQDQMSNTREYIENGSNFDEWKEDPGIALFIYAQLIREFNWNSYKAVFRQYEQTKPNLESNQDKIDHWIETFSRQVNYNLVPLFKFWGFPISQSTIDNLDDLEIPQISDEFIQMAPERYQI